MLLGAEKDGSQGLGPATAALELSCLGRPRLMFYSLALGRGCSRSA